MCVPDKRTYADRREYLKKAVSERRRKLKQMVIEYKGEKCNICGYKRYAGAFDLHHIDASKKSFGLSVRGLTRSWDRIKEESDQCILVCANCHRELHGGIRSFPLKGGSNNKVKSGKSKVKKSIRTSLR